MKTNNLPDYPRITLDELAGLELDKESGRRFEMRFSAGSLGAVGVGFGGVGVGEVLHHYGWIDDAVFGFGFVGCFIGAWVLGIWSHHRMMRARPRSLRSGEEMEPFIIRDVEAQGNFEIAYVDHASGTYFRRIYIESGG